MAHGWTGGFRFEANQAQENRFGRSDANFQLTW